MFRHNQGRSWDTGCSGAMSPGGRVRRMGKLIFINIKILISCTHRMFNLLNSGKGNSVENCGCFESVLISVRWQPSCLLAPGNRTPSYATAYSKGII